MIDRTGAMGGWAPIDEADEDDLVRRTPSGLVATAGPEPDGRWSWCVAQRDTPGDLLRWGIVRTRGQALADADAALDELAAGGAS